MRTYILYTYKNGLKDKQYVFEAQNKDDLRKKAVGKIPDGSYSMYSTTGTLLGYVRISQKDIVKAENKRPFLPKAEYNNLYYFLNEDDRRRFVTDPMKHPLDQVPISPRRYDTLDDARKGALNRSKKLWDENQWNLDMGFKRPILQNISVCVYKGMNYLGFVTYDTTKKHAGTWTSADHPKDMVFLNKDGTIGTKRTGAR